MIPQLMRTFSMPKNDNTASEKMAAVTVNIMYRKARGSRFGTMWVRMMWRLPPPEPRAASM